MANRVILSGPKAATTTGGAATQPLIGEVTAVSAAAAVPVIFDGQTAAKITVTATAPILANFGAADTLFAGVEAMLTYPGKTSDQGWQRPLGIAAATPFSFDLILPYPNLAESWTIYLRARSEKYINALILTGPSTTPNIVVSMNPLSLTAAPNVTLFSAGQNNGDGTFAASMYWDSLRKNMLVDWACLAPVDRSNWSGVQIWIKVPDGLGGFNYVAATGIIGIDAFTASGTDFVHYDTIAVEASNVPVPPQSWDFIAVSAANDLNQTVNRVATIVTGLVISLTTLPKADFVSSFTASITTEWSKDGSELYRLSGAWVNPSPPRYKGIRVIMRMPTGDVWLADEMEGSSSFRTDAFIVPDVTPVNITIYFAPVFGDSTVGAIVPGTTPSVALIISRHGITAPASFTVASVYQKLEATGQTILRIIPNFTASVAVNYGWMDFWALREDSVWYLLGSPNQGGASGVSIITNLPAVPFTWNFLLIAKDINNKDSAGNVQSNPAAPPAGSLSATLLINPPKTDSTLGQVTGWSVSYSYSAPDANGKQSLLLIPTFTPPADFTWSYIEFWAAREDGKAYLLGYPSTSGIASTAIVDSLPVIGFTWAFWAISFDVNNLNSDGKRSVSPLVSVPTGTPGFFSLSVYAPGVLGAITGLEKTSNITFDAAFNGGVNPFTSFPVRADGTTQYQVFTKLVLPTTDTTWGGCDVVTVPEDAGGALVAGAAQTIRLSDVKGVDAVVQFFIPTTVVRLALFFISFDVNGKRNTLNASEFALGGTLTPRKDITVGSITGLADLSKALSSTLGPAMAILAGKLDVALLGVDTSKLANLAVDNTKIAALAVDAAKLATGAVTSGKLGALAVDAAALANSAVTSTKIANLAVGTAAIANSAITSAQIANLAVGTAAIANLAVGSAQIANLGVTDAKINDLAAGKITAGTLIAGVIYAGIINCNQLNAGTINAAITLTSPTILVSSGSAIIDINQTDLVRVRDGSGFGSFVQITGHSVIVSLASSGDKTTLGTSGLACRGSFFDNLNVNFLKLYPYGSGSLAFGIDVSSAYVSGGASAGISTLPTNPSSFLIVTINGSQFKIPFYNL